MNDDGRRRYWGKYRGTVVTNVDPQRQGRLLVQVPDVLGDDPCIWATSASPLAGPKMGLYWSPPAGAGVWVEFEQGDPDFAVWTGSWRGSDSDLPEAANSAPPTQPPIVLQSEAQHRIVVSTTPGEGILIQTSAGASGPSIEISSKNGILIRDGAQGSIQVRGGTVMINGNNLVVSQ